MTEPTFSPGVEGLPGDSSLPSVHENEPSTLATTSSTSRQIRSRSHLTTYVHSVCRVCHHFIDAKKWTFSTEPHDHTSLDCDRCGTKVLGLGRRSTRGSLVSILTTGTRQRRQSSFGVCAAHGNTQLHSPHKESVDTGISPNTPNSFQLEAHKPLRQTTNGFDQSTDKEIEFVPSTNTPKDETNERSRAPAKPSSPKETQTARESKSSDPSVREKRRVRLFRRCVQRIAKIFSSDIDVQVIQQSLKSDAQAVGSRVDDYARTPSTNGQSPILTSAESNSGTQNTDPNLSNIDQGVSREDFSQSRTATNSLDGSEIAEERVSDELLNQHKNDSERLERLKAERTRKTQQRQRRYVCECNPATCPCMRYHQLSTPSSLLTNRDMDSSASSRSPTTRTDTSDSWNQRNSDQYVFYSGGQFIEPPRPRDSVASDTSRRSNTPRHSASSRPSRMSSIALSDLNTSNSRPASRSGQPAQQPSISSPPTPALTWNSFSRSSTEQSSSTASSWTNAARRLFSQNNRSRPNRISASGASSHLNQVTQQEDTVNTMEVMPAVGQSPSFIPGSPISEEPRDDPNLPRAPRRSTPRLDINTTVDNAHLSVQSAAEGDQSDSGSHGNSSRTITPNTQNQMERIRGTRDEAHDDGA